MKEGDMVKIGGGPPHAKGKVGKITYLIHAGAMSQYEKDHYIPVKFENLELI